MVCLFFPVWLQAQQYNFRNWTQEHGLPQSQVTAIMQDNKGQLWLATQGGVSIFNGTSFQNYNRQTGLITNNISCLLQDSKGRIWVGTSTNGVIRYNGNTAPGSLTSSTGLNAGGVHGMAEDKPGRVWFATDSGVFYFDNRSFYREDKFPVQKYMAVRCSPTGEVWAGSASQGLYVVRKDSVFRYTRDNSLPGNSINCLETDKAGIMWIGTDKGIACYQDGNLQPLELPSTITAPDIAALAHDGYNNTWIGFRNNGILKYDGKGFAHITKENGLKTDKITSLATDSESNVWIGTAGHGLLQHNTPWFVHYFDFDHVKEPRITALAHDPTGRLWLGTDDGLVAYQQNGTFKWLEKSLWPKGTTIHHIQALPGQETWLCTSNGVWKIKPGQQTHFSTRDGLPANEVFYCVPDEEGILWFATAHGVARFQNGRFSTLPGPQTGKIYTLLPDQDKQWWLGAENGIFKITDKTVVEVPVLSRHRPKAITAIAEDALGNLYFGGFNYGLLTLDKSRKKASHYTVKEGLPQEDLVSLLTDSNDNLWLGTSRNVFKIPLEPLRHNHTFDIRTYNSQNGFSGIEVGRNTIMQTPDSAIWFGTAKGITRYNPSLDRRNQVYPSTSLTNIWLFMQPTDWKELGHKTDPLSGLPVSPRLYYYQNHITFNFQGICLTLPEMVRYKYKLQGYTDEWSAETEQPFITFANLNPGSYTFELLARNNDGYWTPSPLTYTFSVVPPIWQRSWFIGLIMMLVITSVVSVVRLREQSLVKLNSLLEKKVLHRTLLLEEKNREKETLLKEVHHRVKNNLQIVISLLNLQVRHTISPDAIDVMRAVRNRVRSMSILHERLYQHNDLGQIDLKNYFIQICESLYSSFGVTKERIELHIAVPHIKVDTDSAITLGLIVNEIISNALKYAFPDGQTGKLRIVLESPDNHTYTLMIADNGIGLSQEMEQKQTSFGLQLVDSLLKKLQGKMELKNNNGTIVIIIFVLPT